MESVKKVCLVTGANSGLGKCITMQLAQQGVHVVMICRDPVKGEAVQQEVMATTGNKAVDLIIADLSSLNAIKKLSAEIHQRYNAIHVLINNAGVVLLERKLSVDGIEMTLATNYLAAFALTQLLLDLLKKGAPARIINISSHAHYRARIDLDDLQFEKHPYKFFEAYSNSKLLMNAMSLELTQQLEGTGVTVNNVHPGAVRTNLASEKNKWFRNLLVKFIMFFFINPEKAAKPIVKLALAPEYQNTTGKYFYLDREKKPSPLSLDRNFAKSVWKVSNELMQQKISTP